MPQRGVDPRSAHRQALRVNYTPAWIEAQPERFEALLEENLRYRRPARGIMAQMQAIQKFDVENELACIENPTLVLHGDEDQLLPLPNGESLASRIRRLGSMYCIGAATCSGT